MSCHEAEEDSASLGECQLENLILQQNAEREGMGGGKKSGQAWTVNEHACKMREVSKNCAWSISLRPFL